MNNWEFDLEVIISEIDVKQVLSGIFEVELIEVDTRMAFIENILNSDSKIKIGYEVFYNRGRFKTSVKIYSIFDRKDSERIWCAYRLAAHFNCPVATGDYTEQSDFLIIHPNGLVYYTTGTQEEGELNIMEASNSIPIHYKQFSNET